MTRHVEVVWYERDEHGMPTIRRTSDLYVTAGFYAGGQLGEVFAHIDRAGSTMDVLVDAWATTVSIALQYGIPAETILGKFIGLGSGGPSTEDFVTSDDQIPRCKGPVDYCARRLLLWAGKA